MSTSRLLFLQNKYRASTYVTRFSSFSLSTPSTTSSSFLPRKCPPLLPRRLLPHLPRRHLSSHSRLPPYHPQELSEPLLSRFRPEFKNLYGKHLASKPDEHTALLLALTGGTYEAAIMTKPPRRQHYACLCAKAAEAAGVTCNDVSIRRVPGKMTDFRDPDASPKQFGNIKKQKGYGASGAYEQEADMTLRVYTPPNMSRDAPIVVYFPSGGFLFSGVELEHGLAAHLSILTASMVVSVGYRTAPAHSFPIPVHDAVAAVDWVRTNLAGWVWDFDLMEYVPSSDRSFKGSGGRAGRVQQPRRKIALLGNGCGGGLAAAIGVTEGMQKGIDALGIWCPITDWTFDPVPGLAPSRYSTLPKSPAALMRTLRQDYDEERPLDQLPPELKKQLHLSGRNGLLRSYDEIADSPFLSTAMMELIRDVYLPDSGNWTDPFASPLYFFKTPGLETAEIPEDPILAAEFAQNIVDVDEHGLPIYDNPIADRPGFHPPPPPIKRRVHRRLLPYPRFEHMPLTVPPIRLTLAGADVLYSQGLEFGNAVRASVYPDKTYAGKLLKEEQDADLLEAEWYTIKLGGYSGLFDPNLPANYYEAPPDGFDEKAEKWVEINTVDGVPNCFVSCAGESEAGYKEVEAMAKWLRGVFDGSHGENERILGRDWFEMRENQRKKAREQLAQRS